MGVANEWFAQQTGMRPRWREDSAGRVAVATVRLAATTAAFAGDHAVAFRRLRSEIDAKLDVRRNELLAVWIDARAEEAPCGVYDTAPAQLVIWERACDSYPEPDSTFPRGGATLLLAHEMTHAFGAAYVCAPHDDGAGHVTDDPRDILYAGTERYDLDNLTLDPGRDDYYLTGRADCPGIENSALWERNAAR